METKTNFEEEVAAVYETGFVQLKKLLLKGLNLETLVLRSAKMPHKECTFRFTKTICDSFYNDHNLTCDKQILAEAIHDVFQSDLGLKTQIVHKETSFFIHVDFTTNEKYNRIYQESLEELKKSILADIDMYKDIIIQSAKKLFKGMIFRICPLEATLAPEKTASYKILYHPNPEEFAKILAEMLKSELGMNATAVNRNDVHSVAVLFKLKNKC
jgi:hypothetical protein